MRTDDLCTCGNPRDKHSGPQSNSDFKCAGFRLAELSRPVEAGPNYRVGKTLRTTIYHIGEDQPCAWFPDNPTLAQIVVDLLNAPAVPAPPADTTATLCLGCNGTKKRSVSIKRDINGDVIDYGTVDCADCFTPSVSDNQTCVFCLQNPCECGWD